jgi:hypothetical protein
MNQFLGIFGYAVVIGYLLKIIFQMYLKNKGNEDLNIGPGNIFGWDYWKPIAMKEGSKLNWMRKIFNIVHVLAFVYLAVLALYLILSPKK